MRDRESVSFRVDFFTDAVAGGPLELKECLSPVHS